MPVTRIGEDVLGAGQKRSDAKAIKKGAPSQPPGRGRGGHGDSLGAFVTFFSFRRLCSAVAHVRIPVVALSVD